MKRRSILGRRNRNQQEPTTPSLQHSASVDKLPRTRNDDRPSSPLQSNFNVNPFETPRNLAQLSFNNPNQNWSVFKHVKNWNTPEALSGGSTNRVSAELATLTQKWSNKTNASNLSASHSSALNGSIYGRPLEDTMVDARSTPFLHTDLSNRLDSNQDSSFKPPLAIGKSFPSARRSLAGQNNLDIGNNHLTSHRIFVASPRPSPLQMVREDKHEEEASDIENHPPCQDEDEGEITLQDSMDVGPRTSFESDKLIELLKEQCHIYSKMEANLKKMSEVENEHRSRVAKIEEEIQQKRFSLEEERLNLEQRLENHCKTVCSMFKTDPPVQSPQSAGKKFHSGTSSSSAKKKKRPSVAVLGSPKQTSKSNVSLSTSKLNGSVYGKSLDDTVVDARTSPFCHKDLSKLLHSNQTLRMVREVKYEEEESNTENRPPCQDEDEGEITLQDSMDAGSLASFESDKLIELLKDQCNIYSRMEANLKKTSEVEDELKQKRFALKEERLGLERKLEIHRKLVCSMFKTDPSIHSLQSGEKKSHSVRRSSSVKRKKRPSVAVYESPKQILKPSKTFALLTRNTPRTTPPLRKLAYTPRSLRKRVNDQLSFLYGE